MEFADWLERQGCKVEVTQEDDGSGYVCLEVTPPSDHGLAAPRHYDITVSN